MGNPLRRAESVSVSVESAVDGIDLASAPQRQGPPGLAQVVVEGEAVVYVEDAERTLLLNRPTTAIWGSLDGQTRLQDLVEDLVAVTTWDRSAVEGELVELVRGLGRDGVLLPPASAARDVPDTEPSRVDVSAPRLVRVPAGACTERNDLPWAATRAVRVGRYLLGARSATAALDRLVTDILHGHVVGGVTAPPNYSLRPASADGLRYHRLFRTCETWVRTRSLHRLLYALCGFLAEYAAEQDTTAVHLEALALLRDGRAHLLPRELRPLLPAEEWLNREGFHVLDSATAALDPHSGDLVVQKPLVDVDPDAQAAASSMEPEPDPPWRPVDPGAYPIASWVSLVVGQAAPAGRAAVVAEANRRVRNRTAVGAQATLSTLANVVGSTRLVEVPATQATSTTLQQLTDSR